MEITKKEGWGLNSITVRINIADAIALGQVIAHLDRYDELVKDNPSGIDEETGEFHDPIEICHKEGFEPIDEIMKLRKFCKKLCFVKVADSDIFTEEKEPSEEENELRKRCK